MNPIDIISLSKFYRGKLGKQVVALKDLSLSVSAGEVFGFLGPNGAGKSTTIKTIMGQIRPTSGSVCLFGQPTGASQGRKRVGYLPENPAFYDFLTAMEYLELVGVSFGMSKHLIKSRSQHALGILSLESAANRPIRGYSKGMVQRVGIAQALLHDPDLFIFDEPMSGLDPVGRSMVKQLMLDLKRRGKTIFFSTHVIADVEAVCDRVGVVASGSLQAVYDVKDVLESGIVGYVIDFKCDLEKDLRVFDLGEPVNGRFSVSVPRERFQEFMERLFKAGGQVELIEPQRRSLESLFLEIVKRTL